jgi:hypothetical protein
MERNPSDRTSRRGFHRLPIWENRARCFASGPNEPHCARLGVRGSPIAASRLNGQGRSEKNLIGAGRPRYSAIRRDDVQFHREDARAPVTGSGSSLNAQYRRAHMV